MELVLCESCDNEVEWFAFAAYDSDPEMVHPKVARYPLPMIRACNEHLLEKLAADCEAPGSTRQWVIRKV